MKFWQNLRYNGRHKINPVRQLVEWVNPTLETMQFLISARLNWREVVVESEESFMSSLNQPARKPESRLDGRITGRVVAARKPSSLAVP